MSLALFSAFLWIGSVSVALAQVPLNADPVPPSWHQQPGQNPLPNVDTSHPHEDVKERLEREQRMALNAKRQKEAVADATRLSQLSKELADELAQTDSNKTLCRHPQEGR